MPTYKIIANPVAGRGNGARAEAIVDRVLGRAGVTYDLVETRAPHEAVDLARAAVEQAYDVVIAVGGDGTVHEVVNGLVQGARERTGWTPGRPAGTLAIVPLGTGNDFAWTLGVPQNDPEAACRIVLANHRRVIDLGEVTDENGQSWIFQNMLGAGFDAAAALESFKIHRLRGILLYLVAALRTLPSYREAPEVTVHYNGSTVVQPTLMLCAANGRRTGGGFLMAPDAQLDDGLFDITVAASAGIPTILRLLPHFIRGTHSSQTRWVKTARSDRLVFEAAKGMPVHLEGEIIRTDARRMDIRILKSSLAVIVPAPASQ